MAWDTSRSSVASPRKSCRPSQNPASSGCRCASASPQPLNSPWSCARARAMSSSSAGPRTTIRSWLGRAERQLRNLRPGLEVRQISNQSVQQMLESVADLSADSVILIHQRLQRCVGSEVFAARCAGTALQGHTRADLQHFRYLPGARHSRWIDFELGRAGQTRRHARSADPGRKEPRRCHVAADSRAGVYGRCAGTGALVCGREPDFPGVRRELPYADVLGGEPRERSLRVSPWAY